MGCSDGMKSGVKIRKVQATPEGEACIQSTERRRMGNRTHRTAKAPTTDHKRIFNGEQRKMQRIASK